MKSIISFLLLIIAAFSDNLAAWEKCSKSCASEVEACLKDKACQDVYTKCLKRPNPVQCFGQANSFYSNRILKCAVTKCQLNL